MKRKFLSSFFSLILFILFTNVALSQSINSQKNSLSLPFVSLQISPQGQASHGETSNALKVMILLTILSLAPAIFMMMTSFTRMIIVLGFVRQAIGTQNTPTNQIVIGLAIFLTFFVMAPVFSEIYSKSYEPYSEGQIDTIEAIKKAEIPLREFMLRQTKESEIELMMSLGKLPKPANYKDVPTYILIPSFILSELKVSFLMGFMLYLPFVVLDIVISSVLMAMGMMMLPPVVISLPFKLLLFVLVDGWQLVVGSLVKSFM